MRHVDEYRDPAAVAAVVRRIREVVTRPWTLMEVCGGQTHSILKFGMDELLPPEVSLVHGPGCPVCVTPLEMIDRAIAIASRRDTIFCSFGDMLRVPGSQDDLLKVMPAAATCGSSTRPSTPLRLAKQHQDRRVVFFAVGFETTAPANAMAVHRAKVEGLANFSVLVAHREQSLAGSMARIDPGLAVYWLGDNLIPTGSLPQLKLQGVELPSSFGGPGYGAILKYGRVGDELGPPLLTLQQWPAAAWEKILAGSRGNNLWDRMAAREVSLPSGRATVFAGEGRFLAHVYFEGTVVLVDAPGACDSKGCTTSPFNDAEAMELVVRALVPLSR